LVCSRFVFAQKKIARVGILAMTEDNQSPPYFAPYYRALQLAGWTKGQNLVIDYRHVHGDPTKFAGVVEELLRTPPDAIFPLGPPAVRAAFAATKTIPIIAHDLESDPVAAGYAQTYSRPGGNLTGVFLDTPTLTGKWMEILHSVVPRLAHAVVLWDSTAGALPLEAVKKAATVFAVDLQILELTTPQELEAVSRRVSERAQALIVLPSPMLWVHNQDLAAMAKELRLPSIGLFRPFAESGGLISYGPENGATLQRCAALTAKILSGAKPGDIPIERPDRFEYLVNTKTADAIGVTLPPSVLLQADELISK
jgi:putative ABC transport system substrate-binding protein